MESHSLSEREQSSETKSNLLSLPAEILCLIIIACAHDDISFETLNALRQTSKLLRLLADDSSEMYKSEYEKYSYNHISSFEFLKLIYNAATMQVALHHVRKYKNECNSTIECDYALEDDQKLNKEIMQKLNDGFCKIASRAPTNFVYDDIYTFVCALLTTKDIYQFQYFLQKYAAIITGIIHSSNDNLVTTRRIIRMHIVSLSEQIKREAHNIIVKTNSSLTIVADKLTNIIFLEVKNFSRDSFRNCIKKVITKKNIHEDEDVIAKLAQALFASDRIQMFCNIRAELNSLVSELDDRIAINKYMLYTIYRIQLAIDITTKSSLPTWDADYLQEVECSNKFVNLSGLRLLDVDNATNSHLDFNHCNLNHAVIAKVISERIDVSKALNTDEILVLNAAELFANESITQITLSHGDILQRISLNELFKVIYFRPHANDNLLESTTNKNPKNDIEKLVDCIAIAFEIRMQKILDKLENGLALASRGYFGNTNKNNNNNNINTSSKGYKLTQYGG